MIAFIIIIVIFILFILYGYGSNYICRCREFRIPCNQREWVDKRIVLLADLHGNQFGSDNAGLIRKIQASQPELILVAGDMVVKNGKGMKQCIKLMENLVKIAPVYYSLGNHETRLDDMDFFFKQIRDTGVTLLDNESQEISWYGNSLKITGLTLEEQYYHKFWKHVSLSEENMREYVGEASNRSYELLLAHNPEYFPTYSAWGADLVLSGHVHGGIMSLPWGGAIAPSLRLFPKYCSGQYELEDSHMIVSKGLGLHHIKLRFFNLPEVVTIIFTNK